MPPSDPLSLSPATPERLRYVGDYELLGELARGGMGAVYRARQRTLARTVAVKLIHPQYSGSPEAVARFRREAQAAASLQHPGIVAIHEVGEDGGLLFYSMDLVEGEDLGRKLRAGPLEPAQAAKLVATLADAVQHAHERGVLHRDLKPGNVLLDARGEPHLADFGLARGLADDASLTATGAILGTPAYMAPEQARGLPGLVCAATDVYGLGAILFHALAGRAPFEAPDVLGVLQRVIGEPPPRIHRLRPGVPADLESIALRCLEKDVRRRYASSADLSADLRRYLRGEPVLAQPPSAWSRMQGWLQAHPAARPALMGLAFVAVVMLAFGLWSQMRWLQASPEQRAEHRLGWWKEIPKWLWMLSGVPTCASFSYMLRAQNRRRLHGELPSERLLGWAMVAGAFGVAISLSALFVLVEAAIWRGAVTWTVYSVSNPLLGLMGIMTLGLVVSERRALRMGGNPAVLGDSERHEIRECMRNGDENGAMRIYKRRTRVATEEARRAVRVIAGVKDKASR